MAEQPHSTPGAGAGKPAPMMAAEPWVGALPERLQGRPGVRECSAYLGQGFVIAEAEAVTGLIEYLHGEEDFDLLLDLTAVDYPARAERFELVYILYSFARNERIRVKTRVADGARPASITAIFRGANWLEREVFDMFGIEFIGHPDLKRILLPEEWQGHPLRKEYGITQMDQAWVQEHLGIESGQ